MCIAQAAVILVFVGLSIAQEPISCDPKTGTWDFGLEWVADTCVPITMTDNTEVRFINNLVTCDRNAKSVALLAPYGNDTMSPEDFITYALSTTATDGRHYRIFRNNEGTHFVLVHPSYTGTIDGKSMTDYAEGEVHTDVFQKGFILPATPNCKGGDFNNDPKTEKCIGSSVNLGTGRLSHSQELFSLNNNRSLALGLALNYRSVPFAPSSIGNGWSHSYEETLEPGEGYSMVFWQEGTRRIYNKRKVTDSSYLPPLGDHSTLAQTENGWTITESDGLRRTFDSNGRILSITDRYVDNSLEFTYSGGKLAKVTDATGRAVSFSYNADSGKLETITDPKQNVFTLGFSGSYLSSLTLPGDNIQWLYTYGANGLLESKTDPAQNLTRYSYDAENKLRGATDPLSRTLEFSSPPQVLEPGCGSGGTGSPGKIPDVYHVPGCPSPTAFNLLDKDQNPKTYTYDTLTMSVRTETDSSGNTTNYYYNFDGTMRAKTVPFDGSVKLTTFYTYDGLGNLLTQTEPVDIASYSPPINPQTVDIASLALLAPPIKPAFTYTYDSGSFSDIKTVTDNRGSAPLTTSYDRYSESDGSGGSWLVTRTTVPGETVGATVATYSRQNTNGTIASFTDANGERTSFSYYPVGTGTTSGLLQSITMPDGVKLTYTAYDQNGNATEFTLTDASANDIPVKTTQGYNALNQLTSVLKQSTVQPAAFPQNLTRYGYDRNGNLSAVTDPENRSTTYKYTYQGQLSEITDARQKLTKLDYGTASCPSCANGVDKLTAVRDANHVANNQPGTVYTYDKAGRVETETDPVGKKLRYTYFDSGLVKEKIDATNPTAEKILIRHRYNSRGQLTDKIYSDNSSVHFDYDSNGRLKNASNQTGAVTTYGYTVTYHNNGRLKSVTDTSGKTVSYDEYDGNGQRKKVTYFPGTVEQRVLTYDYDANRPWHIYSPAGTFTFGYDERGRRSKLIYPNGTQADYGYDDLDRLKSQNHSVTSGAPFISNSYPDHDQVGNIKTRTGAYPAAYLYDEVYRLKDAVSPGGTEKYEYDDVGNRIKGPGPKDTKFAYDAANRMTRGKLFGHDYDNAGNQTTRITYNVPNKGWAYTWNDENKLVKAEQIKGAEKRTVTFAYDPFGRRVEKKLTAAVGGQIKLTTWTYAYDNEDVVLETMAEGITTIVTHYIHGPGIDEPLALEREGQFYFYHADHLGSVTTITDGSRNVVQNYTYDSFGMVIPQNSFRNSFTFTGREWDKETGLYYYRARYYDPMEGRFISKDPISFAGGDVNLYAYVENNPVNWIDPSGLSKTKGILNGNDEYLRRLKDANGDRNKINEIKREVDQLRNCKEISNDRWNKIKAWLKLAKDGRLYMQPLLMFDFQKDFLNPFNPATWDTHSPYDSVTNPGGSL